MGVWSRVEAGTVTMVAVVDAVVNDDVARGGCANVVSGDVADSNGDGRLAGVSS
jgi:hypothetical protein